MPTTLYHRLYIKKASAKVTTNQIKATKKVQPSNASTAVVPVKASIKKQPAAVSVITCLQRYSPSYVGFNSLMANPVKKKSSMVIEDISDQKMLTGNSILPTNSTNYVNHLTTMQRTALMNPIRFPIDFVLQEQLSRLWVPRSVLNMLFQKPALLIEEIVDNKSPNIDALKSTVVDKESISLAVLNSVRKQCIEKLNKYILSRNSHLEKVALTITSFLFRNSSLTSAKCLIAIELRNELKKANDVGAMLELIENANLLNQNVESKASKNYYVSKGGLSQSLAELKELATNPISTSVRFAFRSIA